MNAPLDPRTKRTGSAMLWIAWIGILGGGYWFFSDWSERQANPNRRAEIARQSGKTLELQRNRAGHYVVDGKINGHEVEFFLDTGATAVALSLPLARELDLRLGPAVEISTANGLSTGYATRLERIEIGPIQLYDVAALASEGIDRDVILLGMSALKQLEFTQRGDKLTLRVP